MKKFILTFLCICITDTYCPKPREAQWVMSIEEWNNFDPQDPQNQQRLIHAVSVNNLNLARALLGLGVNANLRNAHQYSLVHLAVANNNYEMVKLLLDLQADPNARDIDGRTALHTACYESNLEIVQLLLRHPAIRPYIIDNNGRLPLYFVGGENEQLIRDAFADYNQRIAEQLAEFSED